VIAISADKRPRGLQHGAERAVPAHLHAPELGAPAGGSLCPSPTNSHPKRADRGKGGAAGERSERTLAAVEHFGIIEVTDAAGQGDLPSAKRVITFSRNR
jgi:hypothetical protein